MNASDLEAGRKLDKLIALKVMGWLERTDGSIWEPSRRQDAPVYNVPHYSTEIADAWRVYEKVFGGEEDICLRRLGKLGSWQVTRHKADCHELIAYASKAPHAICLAALTEIRS